jgi:DNA-binding transcriptional ArsR family regulator
MVNQSESLDATFAALADPTRRAILERLAQGGASVTELAAPFAMSLPAVSKHLRVLEGAGLVSRAVEGRVHRMALSAAELGSATRWLTVFRTFWESRLDSLARYVEAENPKEEAAWRRPKPRTRSVSSARSKRRARKSSRHGRGRRK